jgi:hypothetical protein
MKKIFIVSSLILILAAGCSSQPQAVQPVSNVDTKTPSSNQTQNINQKIPMDQTTSQEDLLAILSTDAYGYKVQVLVNGQDIGLKGEGSGGARLFNKEHSYYKTATPDVLKSNGVLVQGKNNFVIKYTKVDPKSDDTLNINLKMQDYSEALFTIDAKDTAGVVEQVIDIEPVQPVDFKSIKITK